MELVEHWGTFRSIGIGKYMRHVERGENPEKFHREKHKVKRTVGEHRGKDKGKL